MGELSKIKNQRIAIYIASDKDEATRQEMDTIVAQSAEYRSRNDFIWSAIRFLLKRYAKKD